MLNTKKTTNIYIFIGFNNPKIHKRGVENIVLLQSKALAGQKIFYVFFGSATEVSKWGNIIMVSIKKFHFLKLNLIFRYLKNRYKANLFIHSHNYQLSCFCWYKTNVFTVHDSITYLYKCFKRKYIFVFALIEKSVYKRAAKIHFISDFAQGQALDYQRFRQKSVIIYNSTPLESLNVESCEKVFFPEATFNIFCVRTIEERSRIDLLIDVCELLAQRNCAVVIKIAGKGPLLAYYTELVAEKKLTNIKLLGYIDDAQLIAHYKSCDLVIMPSEYGEGFGLPIIEGYLFGKPVLASNRCAIPEVIIDKEMLFANQASEVLKKIQLVMDDKSRSDSGRYRQYYEQNFSQSKIVSLYQQKLY